MFLTGSKKQSETMPFDLGRMLRWDTSRRADRPVLLLPSLATIHSRYKEEVASKELADCAQVIRSTGLLFRWKKWTGQVVLCTWDSIIKLFTHFSNESFREFLGAHFDLQEKSGVHFGLPAEPVADRIWQTLLLDAIDLPWASWELTTEYRRSGK
jgi:hypothetical protein